MLKFVPILIAAGFAASAHAAPVKILFVGNSYTFGRTDGSLNPDGSLNLTNQVLTYNAANVRDLTAPRGDGVLQAVSFVNPALPFNATTNPLAPYSGAPFTNVFGTNSYPIGMNIPGTTTQGNSYSPHTQLNTWGGTAGIFKQFTVQAGLDYDVALSTRNAASLRGHLLNTANTTSWDLRSNISSERWGSIVLQEQSDEVLAPKTVTTDSAGRTLLPGTSGVLGSNFPSVRAYVDLIEDWVHTGRVTIAQGLAAVTSFTEREMFRAQYRPPGGSNAQADTACQNAGGGSFCTNTTTRNLGVNSNFDPNTKIYLQETWARPDLINSPGAKTLNPVTALATYDLSTPAPSYFSSLEEMTEQMRLGMLSVRDYADDDGTTGIAGIVPTGQAFLRAVQDGVATRNMYAPDALTDGLIDLWFNDGTHPSKWGSYLSALTLFGSITGLDPQSLGYYEQAARDLGIDPGDAYRLQQVAAVQLGFARVPEPGTLALALGGLAALGVRRRQPR
ncbi:MAG: PEP-CTERM sorting domain-containing protein [Burkholderiales bacterium]|nr:PEP-CTERM sorting domain-containing protein [Burkholderiales bacterium]